MSKQLLRKPGEQFSINMGGADSDKCAKNNESCSMTFFVVKHSMVHGETCLNMRGGRDPIYSIGICEMGFDFIK